MNNAYFAELRKLVQTANGEPVTVPISLLRQCVSTQDLHKLVPSLWVDPTLLQLTSVTFSPAEAADALEKAGVVIACAVARALSS